MGRRYSKSVKIAKGVRINFSKSGPSLSLGTRGHTVNFSSRGTTVRGQRISGKRSSSSVTIPRQVVMQMSQDGKISFFDNKNNEITDPAVIRKIKSSTDYIIQKSDLESQRIENNEKIVRKAQEENERFINIHQFSAVVDTKDDFNKRLEYLRPKHYVEKPYELPYPTMERVRGQLEIEAKETVTGSIFKVNRLRKDYVEQHLQERFDQAVTVWERDKEIYYQNTEREKIVMNQRYQQEYEDNKRFLTALINGDNEAVSEAFDDWISSCELPVEININYDWQKEHELMLLDVDLPEIEDINPIKVIQNASGNVKEKKKTQAELRQEYATLVFGLAIFISSYAFNLSPVIKKILISGYTQRRNKSGDLIDEYVYSLKFYRGGFERRDLSRLSTIDFCAHPKNRVNMTSTYLLKKIVPYENFDE